MLRVIPLWCETDGISILNMLHRNSFRSCSGSSLCTTILVEHIKSARSLEFRQEFFFFFWASTPRLIQLIISKALKEHTTFHTIICGLYTKRRAFHGDSHYNIVKRYEYMKMYNLLVCIVAFAHMAIDRLSIDKIFYFTLYS